MNQNFRSFLNFSRWFAAFLVVICHVRNLILVDLSYVVHKTFYYKAVYFVTGLGHEAVVIFFVISGFLVGGVTLDRWWAHGPKLRAYASARISRIYTVLIPALIVGLSLDIIGVYWFNSSELYTNSRQFHTGSLDCIISAAMDLSTFIGNLFMMQGILTGTLGSNGPLWSLSYEWWYYCVFALVAAALTGTGKKRAYCAAVAIAITLLLPTNIILWSTIWILGIAAQKWIKSQVWRPHPALGIGIFLVATACSRLSHKVGYFANHSSIFAAFAPDFVLGIAYVIALVSATRMTMQVPLPRLHERLAEFSYTTYLSHFPTMLFITAVGYQVYGLKFQLQPGVQGLLYMLGMTVALYSFCFAFFLLTERHTPLVKEKLDSCMGLHLGDTGVRSTSGGL